MKQLPRPPFSYSRLKINISQTQVKSLEATKSIFHRQGVIKSLDPAFPVFGAASSSAVSSNMAHYHLKLQPSGYGPVHKSNRYREELAALRPAVG